MIGFVDQQNLKRRAAEDAELLVLAILCDLCVSAFKSTFPNDRLSGFAKITVLFLSFAVLCHAWCKDRGAYG
jgi:hypothetical protein